MADTDQVVLTDGSVHDLAAELELIVVGWLKNDALARSLSRT